MGSYSPRSSSRWRVVRGSVGLHSAPVGGWSVAPLVSPRPPSAVGGWSVATWVSTRSPSAGGRWLRGSPLGPVGGWSVAPWISTRPPSVSGRWLRGSPLGSRRWAVGARRSDSAVVFTPSRRGDSLLTDAGGGPGQVSSPRRRQPAGTAAVGWAGQTLRVGR